MKKFLKIFFVFAFLVGLLFAPLSQALAQKWNRTFLLIYVPKTEPYYGMMTTALDEWIKCTGKKMSIMITVQKRDTAIAEAETEFNIISGDDAKISGSVEFNETANYYRHAKMFINIVEPDETLDDESKKALKDETYAVMLKTAGKMLGVPESTDENSVMFSKYKEGQKILPSDIDNLYQTYNWTEPKAPAHKR